MVIGHHFVGFFLVPFIITPIAPPFLCVVYPTRKVVGATTIYPPLPTKVVGVLGASSGWVLALVHNMFKYKI